MVDINEDLREEEQMGRCAVMRTDEAVHPHEETAFLQTQGHSENHLLP